MPRQPHRRRLAIGAGYETDRYVVVRRPIDRIGQVARRPGFRAVTEAERYGIVVPEHRDTVVPRIVEQPHERRVGFVSRGVLHCIEHRLDRRFRTVAAARRCRCEHRPFIEFRRGIEPVGRRRKRDADTALATLGDTDRPGPAECRVQPLHLVLPPRREAAHDVVGTGDVGDRAAAVGDDTRPGQPTRIDQFHRVSRTPHRGQYARRARR